MKPLFIITERFDPSVGDGWRNYFERAKIPQLVEVVSLDCLLCPRVVSDIIEEDWVHIEIKMLLLKNNPRDAHAWCELYAVWRLAGAAD